MYQWNRVLKTIYVICIILCDNMLFYGFCLYTGYDMFVWKILLFYAVIVTTAFKMKPVEKEMAQSHKRFQML